MENCLEKRKQAKQPVQVLMKCEKKVSLFFLITKPAESFFYFNHSNNNNNKKPSFHVLHKSTKNAIHSSLWIFMSCYPKH